MAFWGPLIAGGASLLGGILGNKASQESADKQMAFQERMSNTTYQRAVEDMRLAGINPMLAYMRGGASSPGGASASMEDMISPAVSSAMHATRLKQELKNMRTAERQAEATAQNQSAQSQYWWAMRHRVEKENELGLPQATANSARAAARIAELRIPGIENIEKIESGDVGQAGAWLRYFLNLWRHK